MGTMSGKRVVVLGGTAGLGLATAKRAAQEGAAVVVASHSEARVAAAVAALPGATGHAVDLTREADVQALFERIGDFDHLVFTAGEALQLSPLLSTDFQAARRFFELRYWGAYTAARHARSHIRSGGSITFTSGIVSRRPSAGWSLGASLCGAMESLTRALAVELAPLRVNIVCPGVVRTALWSGMSEADREAMFRTLGGALPVGRVGEADDVAQAFLYLMGNGFSTGEVLVVDGGAALV